MIGIGAEYKGRGAFNKANKDVLGLGKGVKTLAKAYIGLAGAQKAFRLGVISVKEFAADDKAIRQLQRTVTNLGLAYESTNVENFIAGLENTYHIADDFLRPAFAKLVQVTGSYTKSKELLTTALNASAGAGVDLTTTVTDLSQAYVGNLKGLKKYNLGLTNAELATMSFEQIQDKLNSTFLGQASLAAATYAGKIDALTIASNNAKEAIGKDLVDAISNAFGRGDIERATANIEKMGNVVGNMVAALGIAAKYSGFNAIASVFDAITGKRNALALKDRKYDPMSGKVQDLTPAGLKAIQARAKVDKEAAKRQKEIVALLGKQTKAVKEQTALAKAKAVLDKASAVFNMDLVQNTAALQGKLTNDETLRVKLQQAILLGNSEIAGKLAQELLRTQEEAMKLNYSNPLGNWSDAFKSAIDGLRQISNELDKLGAKKPPFWWQGNTTDPTEPGYTDPLGIGVPPVNYGYSSEYPSFEYGRGSVPDMTVPSFQYTQPTGNFTYGQGNPLAVEVFIDPSAMAYGINATVIGNTANGNSNSYSTIKSYAGGA